MFALWSLKSRRRQRWAKSFNSLSISLDSEYKAPPCIRIQRVFGKCCASSNSSPTSKKSIPFSCSTCSLSRPKTMKTSSSTEHKPSPSWLTTLISARHRQFRSSVKSWSNACRTFAQPKTCFLRIFGNLSSQDEQIFERER